VVIVTPELIEQILRLMESDPDRSSWLDAMRGFAGNRLLRAIPLTKTVAEGYYIKL
jgi:hypothetical protein